MDVTFKNPHYEFLQFQVTLNRPMLVLDIPYITCEAFATARQQNGEYINLNLIHNIPF
jgi:hypothetical protein